mgnify:CR=1 FL=1
MALRPPSRYWLLIAAVNGLIAVAAGAFGAHGLRGHVAASDMAVFQTAAQYQMYHALALLGVAWLAEKHPLAWQITAAGWGFLAGIILFCGSLYALSLTGSRAFVWLTPAGGVFLLGGWTLLALAGLRLPRP